MSIIGGILAGLIIKDFNDPSSSTVSAVIPVDVDSEAELQTFSTKLLLEYK